MIDTAPTPRQQALEALRETLLAIDQARQAVASRLELNVSDMSALNYVLSSGGLGQKELADQLGFSTSSVTTLIDRLETKRLLQRTPHPNDRRRTIVTITDHGLDTIVQIRDWYAGALDAVPEAQLRAVAASLHTIAGELAIAAAGLIRPSPQHRARPTS